MMEIYALFIWPAIVFGVLIAYGYIVSRKPKLAEQRAAEDARAIEESRQVRREAEDLLLRIEAIQAQIKADEEVRVAIKAKMRGYTASSFVRHRVPKERALVARYVQGT